MSRISDMARKVESQIYEIGMWGQGRDNGARSLLLPLPFPW